MAQLPPKVPNMALNWPEFSHQRLPPMEVLAPPAAAAATQNPSWVDDFLDFSPAKHGTHRRSVSESFAFFDVDECRKSSVAGGGDLERFDEEQFMSMFIADDVAMSVGPNMSLSNPSSPSDHNSINEDCKPTPIDHQKMQQPRNNQESDEVQSSCKSNGQFFLQPTSENSTEKIGDPKRVKRILANRQSAQRSRVRKLQYISELERSVTSLQAEVSVLSPRVTFLDHQRLVLNVDNSILKQRIAALAQDKIFKDAHQEALRKEIGRLREVYNYQQDLKKAENDASKPGSQPSIGRANVSLDPKEQLVN